MVGWRGGKGPCCTGLDCAGLEANCVHPAAVPLAIKLKPAVVGRVASEGIDEVQRHGGAVRRLGERRQRAAEGPGANIGCDEHGGWGLVLQQGKRRGLLWQPAGGGTGDFGRVPRLAV